MGCIQNARFDSRDCLERLHQPRTVDVVLAGVSAVLGGGHDHLGQFGRRCPGICLQHQGQRSGNMGRRGRGATERAIGGTGAGSGRALTVCSEIRLYQAHLDPFLVLVVGTEQLEHARDRLLLVQLPVRHQAKVFEPMLG